MRDRAGSAAAPAARCRKFRRGSFIGVLLPHRLYCTRINGRGPAMRAWIDRTNDGLSGVPADGISLPLKRGTSARPGRLESHSTSTTQLSGREMAALVSIGRISRSACAPTASYRWHTEALGLRDVGARLTLRRAH